MSNKNNNEYTSINSTKKTKLEKNCFNVNKIIFNKEFSRIKIN